MQGWISLTILLARTIQAPKNPCASCQLKALEERLRRLERHHGIENTADSGVASMTSISKSQPSTDPDDGPTQHYTAAAGPRAALPSLRGALPIQSQRKLRGRPEHPFPTSRSQSEAAGSLANAASTMDLIRSLQRRNQEVFGYLKESQSSAGA